ncbi:FGGY family carbohydrate kinase [Planctomycetes bacterium K23_9]|uniref:Glycerol kinase n=1 Tax=Stieleria marina TaxID=1930275 RepID=A0A517P0Q0_9BACT|nr:Glycerol kinase [Planctomycetes bacterium K23_9]
MVNSTGDVREVYLALDQGTHSSRAILIDNDSNTLAKFQIPVGITYPDSVSAEQDADEILQSVIAGIQLALCKAKENHWHIRAAGLATQRSSVVAWNRETGEILSPVISWQDRRAHEQVETLRQHAHEIRQRTGLPLTPHYGASKIRWLLDHRVPVQQCEPEVLGIGPLASFLVAKLTQHDAKKLATEKLSRYLVDHTNALRTQLMNLQELDWDPRLLELFGVSNVVLPTCVPVIHDYGNLSDTTIPLTVVSGDQTAAMFGQGAFPDQTALVNLGTGAFVLTQTKPDESIDEALLGGLSLSDDQSCQYLSEGTVNGCGAATAWAMEQLGLKDEDRQHFDHWLSEFSSPPIFVNLVGGVGSPWWIEQGDSYWCDQDGQPISPQEVSPRAAMVAVLESIAFLVYENLRRMMRHQTITDLRVSGGLSQLDGICHRLANLSQCRVTRSADIEATASGVVWLAAGRPETWHDESDDTLFVPSLDDELANRYSVLVSQLEKIH